MMIFLLPAVTSSRLFMPARLEVRAIDRYTGQSDAFPAAIRGADGQRSATLEAQSFPRSAPVAGAWLGAAVLAGVAALAVGGGKPSRSRPLAETSVVPLKRTPVLNVAVSGRSSSPIWSFICGTLSPVSVDSLTTARPRSRRQSAGTWLGLG